MSDMSPETELLLSSINTLREGVRGDMSAMETRLRTDIAENRKSTQGALDIAFERIRDTEKQVASRIPKCDDNAAAVKDMAKTLENHGLTIGKIDTLTKVIYGALGVSLTALGTQVVVYFLRSKA
jgi:hypothetical protein